MEEFVQYESLDYGCYSINGEDLPYTENVKYDAAEFNKLYMRRVRLPDGKSNVIYLMSDSFENALTMISSQHFYALSKYRRIYYPIFKTGRFMRRMYRINLRKQKPERDKAIKEIAKKVPFNSRILPNKMTENIYFVTSDLYQAFKNIGEKLPIKRLYTEFLPEYIDTIKSMTPEKSKEDKSNSNNRILIIDAEHFGFKQGAPLAENKTNPLFLIYLAYLRTRNLSKIPMDIDVLICSKTMFMKFNPTQLTSDKWTKFRNFLFRLINANLDEYTDNLTDEEKSELEEDNKSVTNIVNETISPYTKNVDASTKVVLQNAVQTKLRKEVSVKAQLNEEIKLATGMKPVDGEAKKTILQTNLGKSPMTKQQEEFMKTLGAYSSLTQDTGMFEDDDDDYEEWEDEIEDDTMEILQNDKEVAEEVLDEIQDHTVPMKRSTSPVNSKRDEKLREQQKKVIVGSETIEEILNRDADHVKIETDNKSAVMHTANENMKQIQFANFDKTYIDKLYMKDLVACFDSLKDKDNPFFITNIDIHDTSTTLDFKETWTVTVRDDTNKRFVIKVDIPKFKDDRFMYIHGTRYIILKQNFYNPLVKDTPDTVILTTNYNKVTIKRVATKSLSSIERIFSLIKKTSDTEVFRVGDSSSTNLRYISSLEFDEIGRRLFSFKVPGCELYFSRKYLEENYDVKTDDDEFMIGMEGNKAIIINEDTGLDRNGRTIIQIIEDHLPADYREKYDSIKGPSQSMYVQNKMAGEFIPIVTTLIVWIGLSKTLDEMGINWKFDANAKKVPKNNPGKKYIRFSDGVLEYEAKTYAELILNGLAKMHPEQYTFSDFDTEAGYEEFVYSQWGSYNGINELINFKEFLIDPITKQVCKDMMLPDDPAGLLIHAVKLLSDNAFVSKANDKSYRVRSIETIPAILYGCLAAQYKVYVKSGRRTPMTLNQNCVIQKLIMEKTVEAYSTLNPVVEVGKTHTISTKGYKGSNSEHSYDEEKRSYDPTAVGKIAITSSPDANIGINRALVIEPTISSARGYRDQVEDVDDLSDVNLFAPTEMLTPGTIRGDDPIRSAIAVKQSGHIVPVENAVPSLISNGFDEALQFHLSDDFVINAEEDGEVVEVNEKTGFVMVKYKSGRNKALPLNPEMVYNSGAGFYLSNQLVPVHMKVGEKFKKDEPLAYHPKYFTYSKMNGLRFTLGPLCKVAICSSYNTYEDAGICTESLSERMKSAIVYMVEGKFKRNHNILSMIKVGDHVNIGDSLITFDTSVEDTELAKFISKLSDEDANILTEESQQTIKTMHAGKVVAIKVYTLLPPESLSPSLGKVVKEHFDAAESKKKFLEKYDKSEGTLKAGYLMTDSTEPIKDRYNSIKGRKGIDVLIEVYIEHEELMGVGDKIALYGPNKQIVSQIVPKGFEPYSEFRPDEEISVFCAPGNVSRRMTISTVPIMAIGKVMVELKRKVKETIKYSK